MTNKYLRPIFLNTVALLPLITSCETEIIDHIDPNPVNPAINDYQPSEEITDSVFSEVNFVRTFFWSNGDYSVFQDTIIKTFSAGNAGIWVTTLNLETLQESVLSYDNKFNNSGTYASAGNKVLFAGGYNGEQITDWVSIYSNQQSWTFAQLSKARYNISGGSVGNLIFFAGGIETGTHFPSNVIDIYNTTTNVWNKAVLKVPRYAMTVVSAGDKIFFAGGETRYYNEKTGNYGSTDLIDIYDAKQKKWSTDRLSTPRSHFLAVSTSSDIYFIAGNGQASNVIDVFNLKTEKWRTILMDSARIFSDCMVAGNLIFFINEDYSIKTVDYYNTITGKWNIISYTPSLFAEGSRPSLIAYHGNRLYLHGYSRMFEYELK